MPYINPTRPIIVLRIEWAIFTICLILFIVCLVGAGIMSQTIISALVLEACTECNDDNRADWHSLADEQLGESVFLVGLLTVGFFGLILLVIHCALNILLRNAIFEESIKKCQTWMTMHALLMVLSVLFTVSRIAKEGSIFRTYGILLPLLGWVYRIMTLCILKQYLDQLRRREQRVSNGYGHGEGRFGDFVGQDRSVTSTMTEMTDIPL